jgi:hypothetical protein
MIANKPENKADYQDESEYVYTDDGTFKDPLKSKPEFDKLLDELKNKYVRLSKATHIYFHI